MSNLKKCEICYDTDEQEEIVNPFNDDYWVHNDCYSDAVGSARDQEYQDRANGFYDETPRDDGWSSKERDYYQYGHSETHTMDADGNVVQRKEGE